MFLRVASASGSDQQDSWAAGSFVPRRYPVSGMTRKFTLPNHTKRQTNAPWCVAGPDEASRTNNISSVLCLILLPLFSSNEVLCSRWRCILSHRMSKLSSFMIPRSPLNPASPSWFPSPHPFHVSLHLFIPPTFFSGSGCIHLKWCGRLHANRQYLWPGL